MKELKCFALLLAGGSGERMRAGIPKQFLKVTGKTLLECSLEPFLVDPEIDGIVLVSHVDHLAHTRDLLKTIKQPKSVKVVPGGLTRQNSARIGLTEIPEAADIVLIHDVARPFVSSNLIRACIEKLKTVDAVVTAIPMGDTLLRAEDSAGGDKVVTAVLDRSCFWRAQTPQGFRLSLIRNAHRLAEENQMVGFTDDCGIVLHFALAPVYILPGDINNLKITFPNDIVLGEASLKWSSQTRQVDR